MGYNKGFILYPKEIKNLKALRILNIMGTKITNQQIQELNWLIPECKILM